MIPFITYKLEKRNLLIVIKREASGSHCESSLIDSTNPRIDGRSMLTVRGIRKKCIGLPFG